MIIRTADIVEAYEAENGHPLPRCGGRIKTADLIGPWQRAQARREAEEKARQETGDQDTDTD